jgi:hypothetical protein
LNEHGDSSFKLEIQKMSLVFGLPTFVALFVGAIMDASTGKSFSEALILASTIPQYDKRLFIELHENCKL